MAYKIPDIVKSRKAREWVLVLAICLLGGVSFGLGKLSEVEAPRTAPIVCATQEKTESPQLAAAAVATRTSTPPDPVATPSVASEGKYVASKSGSVYHLPWCSGAKRIKDTNKVWFDTQEAAESAGYRPASNCKGL